MLLTWPHIVTLVGSPPNAAILSWMKFSARRWSWNPAFRSCGNTCELASCGAWNLRNNAQSRIL